MDLTTLTAALTGLDEAELVQYRHAVHAEIERRRAEPHVDAARTELVVALREAGTITGPDTGTVDTPPDELPAWASPGTDHTRMYTLGAVVTHGGRVWESTHPGLNHWEPGSTGVDWRIWRDITPAEPDEPGALPAWDGQGHAYTAGDIVTHQGQTWRCTQAHTSQTGWAPGIAPSLWTAHTETGAPPKTPATPAWAQGLTVTPGQRYTYNGKTYSVVQGHTTQAGWEPPAVPALWAEVAA